MAEIVRKPRAKKDEKVMGTTKKSMPRKVAPKNGGSPFKKMRQKMTLIVQNDAGTVTNANTYADLSFASSSRVVFAMSCMACSS